MTFGVTIGQAASFAGVTVKAIRHYHRKQVVPEPARDASGYRRYGSADLLRLVQVRTLAAAGVPLAEIAEILAADPAASGDSLVDVDRRLSVRIEELLERRTQLRRLASGPRFVLPERATAVLDRLVELGLEPDFVEAQAESMVLAKALAPEFLGAFLVQFEERLDDPAHVALLKRGWAAASWDAADPRLEALADDLVASLLAHRGGMSVPRGFEARPDAAERYHLINQHRHAGLPALERLTRLVDAKLRAAGIGIPPG